MKYIIRSIKWLVWFGLIFCIIIAIMVAFNDQMSFDMIFQEGGLFKAGSGWKLIAFFLLVAAIYPALTYVKKEVFVDTDYTKSKDIIMQSFKDQEYEMVSEDAEKVTFRKAGKMTRFMRLYEDTTTITKGESPLFIEGIRKDIVRVASAIECACRANEEEK